MYHSTTTPYAYQVTPRFGTTALVDWVVATFIALPECVGGELPDKVKKNILYMSPASFLPTSCRCLLPPSLLHPIDVSFPTSYYIFYHCLASWLFHTGNKSREERRRRWGGRRDESKAVNPGRLICISFAFLWHPNGLLCSESWAFLRTLRTQHSMEMGSSGTKKQRKTLEFIALVKV